MRVSRCLCLLVLASLILVVVLVFALQRERRQSRRLCEPLRVPLLLRAANKTKEAGFESLVLQCDTEQTRKDGCVKCVKGPEGLYHIVVKPYTIWEKPGAQFFEPYQQFHFEFRIAVVNDLDEPTSLHWHGLTPPNGQDGVAYVTELPIQPGHEREYTFREQSSGGMYWAHAHYGLHAGLGLWIPLVLQHPRRELRSLGNPLDVIVMAEDRFRHPYCAFSPFLYVDKCNTVPVEQQTQVEFYVNRKQEQEVIPCRPGSTVRLRLGNAGAEAPWTFNFSSLGRAELLAFDGNDLRRGTFATSVTLTSAQRNDVLVRIPAAECYPVTVYAGSHRGQLRDPPTQVIYLDAGLRPSACPKVVPPSVAPAYSHFTRLTHAKRPLGPRLPNRRLTLNVTTGDQFGGFSLNCPFARTEKFHLCREFKLQLPPYRCFSDRTTGHIVRSRRPCKSCEALPRFNESGIVNGRCWEWSDFEGPACERFTPLDDSYRDATSVQDMKLQQLLVCRGDRVEVTIENAHSTEPNEGHPMHLHGHIFELRRVDELVRGQWVVRLAANSSGPHDTIWVPWGHRVVIVFDATAPGSWLLHCHNDFHLFNGMASKLTYRVDSDPQCNDSDPVWAGNTPSDSR